MLRHSLDVRNASAMQDLLNSTGPMRLKKCKHGHMLYSINDATIGQLFDLYGEFSEGEVELFAKLVRPDDAVIEVGANIGSLTVPLAQFVGPQGNVLAFEPQAVLFQNLCANIALNGHTNVRAQNIAVGKENGSVVLPPIDYTKPGIFGGHSIEGATGGENVALVALDHCVNATHCRLIKIDVEGMEEDVILGATTLIKRLHPFLYVENDRKEKSESLISTIQGLGYTLYWHLPPLCRVDNYFGKELSLLANTISMNMLCVPPGATITGMESMQISSPLDWWEKYIDR
jgi:FkbM family methyltransferase